MGRWDRTPLIDRGSFVPRSIKQPRAPLARFYPLPIGLDLAHTKIGADSPLKPLRPTPNIITGRDLKGYVDLLTPLIDSLRHDVDTNMPAADAATLRKQADEWEKGTFSDLAKGEAARLRAQADAIEKKGLSAANVAAQASFVKEVDTFYVRWQAQRKETIDITKEIPFSMTSGGDWTKLQGYDLEFQTLAHRYEGFGYSLSQQTPPSAPDTPGIPWVKVGIGLGIAAVLVVGGLVVYSRTSSAPSSPAPAPRRVSIDTRKPGGISAKRTVAA